jgi:hypothetical protein
MIEVEWQNPRNTPISLIVATLNESRLTGSDLYTAFKVSQPEADHEIWNQLLIELGVESFDVSDSVPSLDVLRALPAEFIRTHQTLPIDWKNGVLWVAMPEPTDQELLQDLHLVANAPIRFV